MHLLYLVGPLVAMTMTALFVARERVTRILGDHRANKQLRKPDEDES